MKIKTIYTENFQRGVGVSKLSLEPGFNLIMGPSNSGKSTMIKKTISLFAGIYDNLDLEALCNESYDNATVVLELDDGLPEGQNRMLDARISEGGKTVIYSLFQNGVTTKVWQHHSSEINEILGLIVSSKTCVNILDSKKGLFVNSDETEQSILLEEVFRNAEIEEKLENIDHEISECESKIDIVDKEINSLYARINPSKMSLIKYLEENLQMLNDIRTFQLKTDMYKHQIETSEYKLNIDKLQSLHNTMHEMTFKLNVINIAKLSKIIVELKALEDTITKTLVTKSILHHTIKIKESLDELEVYKNKLDSLNKIQEQVNRLDTQKSKEEYNLNIVRMHRELLSTQNAVDKLNKIIVPLQEELLRLRLVRLSKAKILSQQVQDVNRKVTSNILYNKLIDNIKINRTLNNTNIMKDIIQNSHDNLRYTKLIKTEIDLRKNKFYLDDLRYNINEMYYKLKVLKSKRLCTKVKEYEISIENVEKELMNMKHKLKLLNTKKLELEIQNLEDQLSSIKDELKVCPVCGSSLSIHHKNDFGDPQIHSPEGGF